MKAEIDQKQLRAACRARKLAAAYHIFDPNVSLIDVGWRIKDGRLTDQLAVRAHLRRKLRGAAYETFSAASPQRVIDAGRIGFPVDIIEAEYRRDRFWSWPQPQSARARSFNPLKSGISISNEWDFNYGTLGAIARDRETNDPMILSAWHVLAGSAYAPTGQRILQPGYGDGGRRIHTVARLTRHAMNQGIDAAVARIESPRQVINDQLGVGPVAGQTAPLIGINAIKSGRATDVTEAQITGIDGITKISYGGFPCLVRHVVHLAQTDAGGEVSSGGDSGACWLDKESRLAIGLHYAGSNFPEYALAIAMPQVLDALNVDLLTMH